MDTETVNRYFKRNDDPVWVKSEEILDEALDKIITGDGKPGEPSGLAYGEIALLLIEKATSHIHPMHERLCYDNEQYLP